MIIKAELVFNDLSVIRADSINTARDWFTETLGAVAELIHEEVCKPVLHAKQDLHEILLTDDYGFTEWLEEDYQDDLRLLALQLTTQTPAHDFLKAIEAENDDFCRSEFHLKSEPNSLCNALGIALISDGISLSFPSQPQWCLPFIEIEQVLYDEELKPEQTVIYHRVRSVSKIQHVDSVVRDWRRSIGEQIHNTDDLLSRWQVTFPYLDLCNEYKNKLLPDLTGETFKSVCRRLRQLDDSCHIWKNEIPPYPMFTRHESSSTMKKIERANMRLATCPNNGKQHFIMHCNIQPKGYRLYWFEDKTRKRLTIGYAGAHLETTQHKAQ